MPLYEYKCSKCEEIFEVIQKFSDEPLKKHAGCGGKVAKMLSAPAFQLKGTGWYATDYKKAAAAKSDTASEGNGDKPASGDAPVKTEAKPDTKPVKTETPAKKE